MRTFTERWEKEENMKKSRVFTSLLMSMLLTFMCFLPVAAQGDGQNGKTFVRAEAENKTLTAKNRETPTDFTKKSGPDAEISRNLTAEWPSGRGNAFNNGLISVQTARSAGEASLKWKYRTTASYSPSDMLIVNNHIYMAGNDKLTMLDKNGTVQKQATLSHALGYVAKPTYGDGVIFVPIDNGQIEAFSADGLKSLWVSDASAGKQTNSALTYADGYLYTAITNADWSSTTDGEFLCLDAGTGKRVWSYTPSSQGYYWSGAVVVGNAVIVGGDDGELTCLNAKNGAVLGKINAGAGIRSTIVYDKASDSVFFTTVDGMLHKVKVQSDGKLGTDSRAAFSAYSTGMPVIVDGKAFVGGSNADYSGNFSVIDVKSMKVLESVSAPAEVKGAPLVTSGYNGRLYAYATVNKTPGALYVYEYGAGVKELTPLYTPEGKAQNYCMYSPVADAGGTLYYANDSGYLFAVGAIQPSGAEDNKKESSKDKQVNDGKEKNKAAKAAGVAEDENNAAANKKTNSTATGDLTDVLSPILMLAAAGSILTFRARKRLARRV